MNKKLLTLFGCIAILIVVIGLWYKKESAATSTSLPVVPITPTIENKTSLSNDSKEKLTISMTENDQHKTYTLHINHVDTNKEQELFTQTVAKTTNIVIPYNTWAPDNAYFFLLEKSQTKENVLVFKTSGEPFANQQQYINITELFVQKQIPYIFKEATGWAAPLLLIITTTQADGSKGPSFWFETDTQSFIQLAR